MPYSAAILIFVDEPEREAHMMGYTLQHSDLVSNSVVSKTVSVMTRKITKDESLGDVDELKEFDWVAFFLVGSHTGKDSENFLNTLRDLADSKSFVGCYRLDANGLVIPEEDRILKICQEETYPYVFFSGESLEEIVRGAINGIDRRREFGAYYDLHRDWRPDPAGERIRRQCLDGG